MINHGRFNRTLAICTFAGTIAVQPASLAAMIDKDCMVQIIEEGKAIGVNFFTRNLKGRTYYGKDLDTGNTVTVKFGSKRLGFGMTASVYPVDSIRGLPALEGLPPGSYVAKVTHSTRVSKRSFIFTRREVVNEVGIVDAYRANLSEIADNWRKSHPDGRVPAWGLDGIPSPGITAVVQTPRITIALKPFIKGKSLSSIAKELKPKSFMDLPQDMRDSLRDIYDYSQASLQAKGLRVPNAHDDAPFSLDINPSNEVWVDDPVEMKKYHLSRPSFIFYEIGHRMTVLPHFEDFEAEVDGYLKHAEDEAAAQPKK